MLLAANQPAAAEAVLRQAGLDSDFFATSAVRGVAKLSPAFFQKVLEVAGAPGRAHAMRPDASLTHVWLLWPTCRRPSQACADRTELRGFAWGERQGSGSPGPHLVSCGRSSVCREAGCGPLSRHPWSEIVAAGYAATLSRGRDSVLRLRGVAASIALPEAGQDGADV
jgi:hypothetical protein